MENNNTKKFNVAPRQMETHADTSASESGGGRPLLEESEKNDKVITTYVRTEIRELLKEKARLENRTVAQVVRSLIEKEVASVPALIFS